MPSRRSPLPTAILSLLVAGCATAIGGPAPTTVTVGDGDAPAPRTAAREVVGGPSEPARSRPAPAQAAALPEASPSPSPLPAVVQAVRVEPAALVLTAGETRKVNATVAYADGTLDGNVSWSSSDDRILTVDRATGRLQAVAEGVATLVAAATLEPRRRALVTVTVHAGLVEEAIVRVTPASLALRVGEARPLSATVQRSDGTVTTNVRYETSSRAVALVSGQGLVTGIGPGRAVISVTASGDATRRAVCEVVVTE